VCGDAFTGVVKFNPKNNQIEQLVINGFPDKISHAAAVYVEK
jgi:hypothetical protein